MYGDLLSLAETKFDLLVTSDQNIRYQQNLARRRIAILELSTNDIERILEARSLILDAIEAIQPGNSETSDDSLKTIPHLCCSHSHADKSII
jgi:hypothetical protein